MSRSFVRLKEQHKSHRIIFRAGESASTFALSCRLLWIVIVFVIPAGVANADPEQEEHHIQEDMPFFEYNDHGKRDPFQHLVDSNGTIIKFGKELSVTDLNLEGIMVDDNGNNIAIINGLVVKIHDTIGPFVINKITTNIVILKRGKDLVTLKLKKEDSYD